MPLSTVRALFKEMTGREDLTSASPINDIFYINAGKRFIESMLDTGKVNARHYINLSAGMKLVSIPSCRSIHKVILYDSSNRYNLVKADINYLREQYSSSSLTAGRPVYYAPTVGRPYPASFNPNSLNQPWSASEVSTTYPYYNAILIFPPSNSSSDYTIEVTGLFYTEPFSADSDTNYWTESHPELLAMAAAYILEVTYRNTEGAKDWLNAITILLSNIEKDFIDEELSMTGDSMEVKAWSVR